MGKKLSVLLLFMFLLILAACSQKNPTVQPQPVTPTPAPAPAKSESSKTESSKTEVSKTEEQKTDIPIELGEISFVVPYSAGGGFDVMARTLSPYLEKYLPGNTKVIVKNVPGGNGVIGITEVLKAKPDGRTIAVFNIPGFIIAPIVGDADYDLTKIEWIGQVSQDIYLAAASTQSGITSLDDIRSKSEVKGGMAGLSDTGAVGAMISADKLGFNLKPIPHSGSTEGILSAIRGDVDFVQYPVGSLDKYVVDSNELVPLWVYSEQRLPELPDVPTIVELGYPELLEVVSLRRTVGTTPGTPPEIVMTLEQAVEKALADPELFKTMDDGKMYPYFTDGETTLQSLIMMTEQMEQYKELFKN